MINSNMFDHIERAKQKEQSREQDELDLKSGKKTREQLSRENYILYGLKFRILFGEAKSLA